MIVWSGRGGFIVLVFIACMFIGNLCFPKYAVTYVFAFTCLLSATFSWLAGIAWNTKNYAIVIDKKTGKTVALRNVHKLFWIPMQYWGIILGVVGIRHLFLYYEMQSTIQNWGILHWGVEETIKYFVISHIIWTTLLIIAIFSLIIIVRKVKKSKENRTEEKKMEPSKSIVQKETEELLKKRAEKEDHSRFMPK